MSNFAERLRPIPKARRLLSILDAYQNRTIVEATFDGDQKASFNYGRR